MPAATLIVMRPAAAAPELLMIERAAGLAFAGGAMVFPGGRVEAADRALAARACPDADDGAFRIAAVRETIEEAGMRVAADTLVPFARWRPTHRPHRNFDTMFYLAELPDGAPDARVDGAEAVAARWITARDALVEADAGRLALIFPTRRTLERLALFSSYAEAVADARRWPIRAITPWIEARGGVDHLCIPDDLGFPVTAEPLATVARG